MAGLQARRWQAVELLAIGLLAGALAVGMREVSGLEWLEHSAVDARFSIRGEREPPAEVVVVAVDVESLRHVARPPIPRPVSARLVDILQRAGASVVAFDFTLEQPTDDRAADLRLARALERTGAAVVSVNAIRTGGQTERLVGRVPFDASRVFPGNTFLPDDSDGAVRRYPVGLRGVPSFALLAAALHDPDTEFAEPPRGALIDYAGPPRSIRTVSLIDVLQGRVDAGAFRHKIVVFGPTAPVYQDLHPTGAGGSQMSGPEIHANAIVTALEGYPLRALSSGPIAALLLTIGVVVALVPAVLARRRHVGSWTVAAVGGAVLAAWTVAAQLVFDAGTVVDYSAGVFAILASCVGASALLSASERHERSRMRKLFAAYSPTVVTRILAQDATDPTGLSGSDIIAGYTIEGVIGEGGMGVVYRATDRELGRAIALKLIRPEYALAPLLRARFEREIRAASLVAHPNIVPVLAAGDDDGLLYIAMMLVDGRDLARTIAVLGPLDPELLITLIRQVASALDAAHAKQFVHRDVKPSNILLTSSDPQHAYLTDFGIAKQLGGGDDLTKSSAWVGTVDYLAPEIAAGEEASPLSDIYALSAVVYFCITGVVPFDQPNAVAKLRAHAEADPPRISAAAPGAPLELDAVIARGMAKRPDDRYATASELAEAAARAFGHGGTTAQPRTPPSASAGDTGSEPTK